MDRDPPDFFLRQVISTSRFASFMTKVVASPALIVMRTGLRRT
jgi:hypothetical protein